METQNEDAENKCFTLPHVHAVAIGPNPSSGEYMIKLKNALMGLAQEHAGNTDM